MRNDIAYRGACCAVKHLRSRLHQNMQNMSWDQIGCNYSKAASRALLVALRFAAFTKNIFQLQKHVARKNPYVALRKKEGDRKRPTGRGSVSGINGGLQTSWRGASYGEINSPFAVAKIKTISDK